MSETSFTTREGQTARVVARFIFGAVPIVLAPMSFSDALHAHDRAKSAEAYSISVLQPAVGDPDRLTRVDYVHPKDESEYTSSESVMFNNLILGLALLATGSYGMYTFRPKE